MKSNLIFCKDEKHNNKEICIMQSAAGHYDIIRNFKLYFMKTENVFESTSIK